MKYIIGKDIMTAKARIYQHERRMGRLGIIFKVKQFVKKIIKGGN